MPRSSPRSPRSLPQTPPPSRVNGKLASLPRRKRELPANTPQMQLAKIDLLEVMIEQNREMIALLEAILRAVSQR